MVRTISHSPRRIDASGYDDPDVTLAREVWRWRRTSTWRTPRYLDEGGWFLYHEKCGWDQFGGPTTPSDGVLAALLNEVARYRRCVRSSLKLREQVSGSFQIGGVEPLRESPVDFAEGRPSIVTLAHASLGPQGHRSPIKRGNIVDRCNGWEHSA